MEAAGLNKNNEVLSFNGAVGKFNYQKRFFFQNPFGISESAWMLVDAIEGAPMNVKDDLLRVLKQNNANIAYVTDKIDDKFVTRDIKTDRPIATSFKEPDRFSEATVLSIKLARDLKNIAPKNTFEISNPRSVVLKDLHAQGLDIPLISSIKTTTSRERNIDVSNSEISGYC